jgi:hypothetical protein
VKGTCDIPDDVKSNLEFTDALFGPIFATGVDTPGRHTYLYPEPISPATSGAVGDPLKHIDVVTIRNTDVSESNVGRSDDDTFNVHTLQGKGLGDTVENYRSWMWNYQPIVNQVSIERHGIRAREIPTEFNSYFGVGTEEGRHARRNLVRWQLLLDHWYQHNIEYLTGTISLRGMPNIRVGYRLDWIDRHESYYVESVQHHWQYGSPLQTTVSVSRGQRNDPFPAYIPPVFTNTDGSSANKLSSGNRFDKGRLAKCFIVVDTKATVNSTGNNDYAASLNRPNTIDEFDHASMGGRAVYPSEGDTFISRGDAARLLDAHPNEGTDRTREWLRLINPRLGSTDPSKKPGE